MTTRNHLRGGTSKRLQHKLARRVARDAKYELVWSATKLPVKIGDEVEVNTTRGLETCLVNGLRAPQHDQDRGAVYLRRIGYTNLDPSAAHEYSPSAIGAQWRRAP